MKIELKHIKIADLINGYQDIASVISSCNSAT